MDETTVRELVRVLEKYKNVYSKQELQNAVVEKGYDLAIAKEVARRIYEPANLTLPFELPKFALPIFTIITLALIAMIILMAFPGVETTVPKGNIGAVITDNTATDHSQNSENGATVSLPITDEQLLHKTQGTVTYVLACDSERVALAVQNANSSELHKAFSEGCSFTPTQTLDLSEVQGVLGSENFSQGVQLCYGWWPGYAFEVTGSKLNSNVSGDVRVVFKVECGDNLCSGGGYSCSISKYFGSADKEKVADLLGDVDAKLNQSEENVDRIVNLFKQNNYAAVTPTIKNALLNLSETDANLTDVESKVGTADATEEQRLKYKLVYYRVLALQSIANLNDTIRDDAKLNALADSEAAGYESAYPPIKECETANENAYNKFLELKDSKYAPIYSLDSYMKTAQDAQFACTAMRDLTYAAEPDMRRDTLLTGMASVLNAAHLKN